MQVKLITPDFFREFDDVVSVSSVTSMGSLMILDNHQDFLSPILSGWLKIVRSGNKVENFLISGVHSTIEVLKGRCRIISGEIIESDRIEKGIYDLRREEMKAMIKPDSPMKGAIGKNILDCDNIAKLLGDK